MESQTLLKTFLSVFIVNNRNSYFALIKRNKDFQWIKDQIEKLTQPLQDPKYKFSTKCYWVLHDFTDFPKCQTCEKPLTYNINFFIGYGQYCSVKCGASNKNTKLKIKATLKERYGDENYCNIEKIKATKIKKYGSASYVNSEKAKLTIQQKIKDNPNYYIDRNKKSKATKLKLYGDENYMAFGSNAFKKVLITKYGVDNAQKSTEIKAKTQQTCLEKYGVINGGGSKKSLAKREQTCLEKYGTKTFFETEEFKDKAAQTSLVKYGTLSPNQNPEIRKKQTAKYTYDGISFDSQPEIALYIYLIDNKIPFEYQPNICFKYIVNDKEHKYFPDFMINGQYYEIKGDQFFDENGNMHNPYDSTQDTIYQAKHKCMIDNNVNILLYEQYEKYLEYIDAKYGKLYLNKFKNHV